MKLNSLYASILTLLFTLASSICVRAQESVMPLAPPDSLVKKADAWFDSLARDEQFVTDVAAVLFVNKVADDLLVSAGYPPDSFSVYIQNSLTINAMMFPNRKMVLTSGLLLRLNSREELAMVIGHELGHYLLGHFLELLKDDPEQLRLKSFVHEYEADSMGLAFLGTAKLPLAASYTSLEKLPPQAGALVISFKTPFMRKRRRHYGPQSHPPTPRRVERMKRLISGVVQDSTGTGEAGYHQHLSALRNAARWNMLLDGEARNNNTTQIIIIDSILTNLPDDRKDEYYGYLLQHQTEAIIRLYRMGGGAALDLKFGQARLTYRNNDLEKEATYYNIKIFDLLSAKSAKQVHELFGEKLTSNLEELSRLPNYSLEQKRLKGLYLEYLGRYTEARKVITEYLAHEPTHPGRRHVRSLLKRMPTKDRKKPKF